MRRIGPVVALVAAVLCGGLAAAVDPSPADAAIASSSGEVRRIAAPPSVRAGALTSKSSIAAFAEADPVTLSSSLTVNAPAVGTQYTRRSQLPSRSLAAGTVVASHFLHADVGSGSRTFQGRVVFDRPIAGLLTSDAQLDATDATFRPPTTQYPTGTTRRGVEFADHASTPNRDEWVRLVNDTTLEVSLNVATLDQLRVLTYANQPPTAAADAFTAIEDTTLDVAAPGVLANDRDPEGAPLSATVTRAPTNGTVALATNGSFRYVPANNFAGTDSFAYAVSDGRSTASATATITVQQRDDATSATADAYEAANGAVDVPAPGVLANDADPDGPLTASLEAAPAEGTVTVSSNGSISYRAGASFDGSDQFRYRATDPNGGFGVATVTITGAAPATAPDARDDQSEVTEGEPLVVAAPGVLANDARGSGGELRASLVQAPASGTVELAADGGYRYRPNPGYVGTDRFTYRAADSTGSDTATVTVVVEPMTMSFSQSALEGGSIVNVVAVDPRLDGSVLAGSDVAGVYRSTNWGASWQAVNTGLFLQPSVAALQFSPTVPGKAYAAMGNGSTGGIAVSLDGGVTWETRSTAIRFDGGHGRPGRVTGHLLAFDDARRLLYAASWNQGVMRSADDGRTWQAIGLTGSDLRSLVIDPQNPDVLYATTYLSGVYKTTNASAATPTWTALQSSPRDVEELRLIGRTLYGASGFDGVHSSSDGGVTWQRLGSGPAVGSGTTVPGGPVWVSIDGYQTASGTTLYAGALYPARNGTGYDTVLRSTDGGATWTSMTPPSSVHTEIGGPGGQQWWWDGESRLDRANAWANHIEVDAGAPDRVMVAGRMDIYATSDAGANWYPMVEGLGVTVNRGVAVDPNRPSRVYVPTMDWVSAYSDDGLRNDVHRSAPPGSANPRALALDSSTVPATVYLGTGDIAASSNGELYSNPDPATSPWVSEGLAALTGSRRVIGVAAGQVQGERIVLAVVEQSGLWRKSGGTWTRVSTSVAAAFGGSSAGSWFAWQPGSSTVFLYDRTTGIWRSSDAGRTWTMIWQKPSTQNNTGYLAIDPTNPATLYVSAGFGGLFRLDNATTGTVGAGITATPINGFSGPGPVAVDRHGRVYVASPQIGEASRLSMSTDRGVTWRELGDAVWRATAIAPFSLDIAPDGTVYAAMRGMGVLIASRS